MIDFYTWQTPNGRKIAIMLEECGLAYTPHAIDIGKDEQFAPTFVGISPNGKIPAIIDHDTREGPVSIFESAAILIYLAEKTGRFLAPAGARRAKTLQWLTWQVAGVGPMLGQANHFNTVAPEKIEYAIDRFTTEATRLLKVMNSQLEHNPYIAGDDYSIADIALYPWIVLALKAMTRDDPGLAKELAATRRWTEKIGERAAVKTGMSMSVRD